MMGMIRGVLRALIDSVGWIGFGSVGSMLLHNFFCLAGSFSLLETDLCYLLADSHHSNFHTIDPHLKALVT